MTGRGIGRGIARVPAKAAETAVPPSTTSQPAAAAVAGMVSRQPAAAAVAGVVSTQPAAVSRPPSALLQPGVGRGRGVARVLPPTPTAPSPSTLSRQESTATPTIGRGTLGRRVGAPVAGGGDAVSVAPADPTVPVQSAAAPIGVPQSVAAAKPSATANLGATAKPSDVAEQLQKLEIGANPAATTTRAPPGGPQPQAPPGGPQPQAPPGGPHPQAPPGGPQALRGDGSRPTDVPAGAEGALLERQRRQAELQMIHKPKGQVGRKINLLGNVVHFDADPAAMVYEYRVDFFPQTWSGRLRTKLIAAIENKLPGYHLFDFDNLFLAAELPREEQDFIVPSPFDPAATYKMTIRKVMSNRANESKELLNLIVKELEIAMKFTQIGRNRYNPKNRVALQQGNMPALEIWPGFQTSVNPFTGGVLLMTDPAFRVVRVGNVRQLMDTWKKANPKEENFHKMIKDNLLGSTVLTPYNDKSYVVSEVVWDKTPLDTFETREGAISYVQYYKQHHNIEIKDVTQPLMYSRPTPTGARQRDNRVISLIPELCQLTGIQDDLRANFNAMKAITTTTKLSPGKRYEYIMEYLNAFVQTDVAKELMANWGIKIGTELIPLPGRLLPLEMIQFSSVRGGKTVPENGDWTRDVMSTPIMGSRELRKWTLIFQGREQRMAEDFDRVLREVGGQLGMLVANPSVLPLSNDQSITYVNGINVAVKDNKSEMVVIIFPTPRDDRYAAVKKACYVVHGVASQCINQKTLSRPDRMRAIVQKIALQMNCKLGGFLWRMGKFTVPMRPEDEPLKMMVIGIDAYHDLKRQRESVTAMVASTDDDFTRWHSRCNFQNPKTEMGAGLKVSFMSALNSYVKANKNLPNCIVIFRDGLSDDELNKSVEHELSQITDVCRNPALITDLLHSDSSGSESSSSKSEMDYNPEVYFLVVQKRINQRLFLIESASGGQQNLANPKPGTVVDEVITRRDMYDFYLVPQNVREGSVTPVHFIVLSQPRNPRLTVDHMQNLAYKLTHMYYNWTGTIRVPAPCMYAHKLAYQSGACYDRTEPKIDIADKLYFL